jgi:hypothetical protein
MADRYQTTTCFDPTALAPATSKTWRFDPVKLAGEGDLRTQMKRHRVIHDPIIQLFDNKQQAHA